MLRNPKKKVKIQRETEKRENGQGMWGKRAERAVRAWEAEAGDGADAQLQL